MNREILYRAFDKNTNQFYYSDDTIEQHLSDGCDPDIAAMFALSDFFEQHAHLPIDNYTGLLDKNGKRIFEGDILEYEHREVADNNIMAFYQGTFGLKHGDGQVFFPYRCEIIGNLYETPEILK